MQLLDKKDRKIILFLLEEPEWKSINQLRLSLNLSRSNLNYHIQHINNVLAKSDVQQIDLQAKKIENLKELRNFYENLEKGIKWGSEISKIFLNFNERKLIIIILLLFNKQITLKKLSDILDVSTNTIFNDINYIKKEEYIKKLNIKFKITKNGYSLESTSYILHKLMVNTLIELFEIDNDKNLLYFIVHNIDFDDYHFLKKKRISNIIFFEEILQLVSSTFKIITFKNFNELTISLMLFLVFIRKFNFELKEIERSEYIKNKEKFEATKWYQISSQLINKIKNKYELQNVDIGHFEKLYLAQMISYYFSKDININDFETEIYSEYYNFLKDYLEDLGYIINTNMNQISFIKCFCYFQLIPFKNLFEGNWINKKIDLLRTNPQVVKFLNDFDKFNKKIATRIYYENIYQELMTATIFLTGIVKIPSNNTNNKNQNVVLITNLTNISLNMWIYQIFSLYSEFKNYKIVSPHYFRINKEKFIDDFLITNINEVANDNIVYVSNK